VASASWKIMAVSHQVSNELGPFPPPPFHNNIFIPFLFVISISFKIPSHFYFNIYVNMSNLLWKCIFHMSHVRGPLKEICWIGRKIQNSKRLSTAVAIPRDKTKLGGWNLQTRIWNSSRGLIHHSYPTIALQNILLNEFEYPLHEYDYII